MILMRVMTRVLFLGGWLAPFGVPPFIWVPGPIWFALKIAFVLFCFLWVRATFPRYRYDQLMRLGWKVFLPFSLFWLVATAGFLVAPGLAPKGAPPPSSRERGAGPWHSSTVPCADCCSSSWSEDSGSRLNTCSRRRSP